MKTYYWQLANNAGDAAIFHKGAQLIKEGQVVAFPTETVYGLGANGLNSEAVAKIYQAKGRPSDNPLILHIAKREDIEPLTTGLTANAKVLMEHFWPGPLTLIVAKSSIIPDVVSAGLSTVAVRFPSNPQAQAFIAACGCPIAAPSANLSGRPSPTNGADVLEDMEGRIAGIIDGGACGIGLESTVVDTTEPVPVILRPGGITYEMLTEVLGAVEIDPALQGDTSFKPKAPGMKYRHYAPQAPMYLLEGEAAELLPQAVAKALEAGKVVGVLCDAKMAQQLPRDHRLQIACWGESPKELAEGLFYLLRDFDRTKPDLIIAQGIREEGLGLAIMNRMRKAAGYQSIFWEKGSIFVKNPALFPGFMLQLAK